MSGYGAVAAPMHRDWPHWPPCIAEKTNVGVDFLKLDEVRLLEVGTPQHSACSESRPRATHLTPSDLEGDLEGHWACSLKSPFKMLNFEYYIDI